MLQFTPIHVGFACLVVVSTVAQVHAGGTVRRDRFIEIKAEYGRQFDAYVKAVKAATTDKQREDAQKIRPSLNAFGKRFLALAQEIPSDGVACDALLWIASNYGRHERMKLDEALDLIERHHLASPKLKDAVDALAYADSPRATALAETIAEKAGDRNARGLATLFLAYGTEARSGARDAKSIARIESLMERIKKDYADVVFEKKTLGEMAEGQLFAMRNLVPGKTAPDLGGVDVAGKKVRLSDHRGKVVLLVFWGSWCGPCMAEVPHLRELMTKYAGRPFTILGVNCGDSKEKALKAITDEKMTWPVLFDGEDGPILRKWNVTSFPTLYVIDAHGVIRLREMTDEFDDILDGLVREANRK